MGCGAVIEVHTGAVIDFKTFSKTCPKCAKRQNMLAKGKMSQEMYQQWKIDHKDECLINFKHGASGDMEKEAATTMWPEAPKKNKMRYMTMVGDGDTKTFKAITDLNPYGKKKVK